MSKTFRDLVLLPIAFLLAIVTAIGFSIGSWTPLIGIALMGEHLYSWNSSIAENTNSDFRSFFAEQYTKYAYSFVIILLGLVAPYLWALVGFWFLFLYPANFIILRSFAGEGVERLSSAAPRESKVVSLDNDSWKANKKRLLEYIESKQESPTHSKIREKIEYSVYLRSPQATALIDALLLLPDDEHPRLLEQLNDKM